MLPSRSRLLMAAAAGLLVAVSGCAESTAPALTVGDVRLSHADVLAEVREWAGNPEAIDPAVVPGAAPGSYSMDFVGQVIGRRAALEVDRQRFDELGLTVTPDMEAAASNAIFGGDQATAEAVLGGFSDEYAQEYLQDAARFFALGEQDPEYEAWRTAQLTGGASIEVNARYGTWDDENGVVAPPDGPRRREDPALPVP